MNANRIELEKEGGFRPHERIRGHLIGGDLGGELRLFWATSGRGTEEVGVVDSCKPGADGAFDLKLPGAPYSVSGRLVSVDWALEWVDDSGVAIDHREILVSPSGERVVLGHVAEPRSDKAKAKKNKMGKRARDWRDRRG